MSPLLGVAAAVPFLVFVIFKAKSAWDWAGDGDGGKVEEQVEEQVEDKLESAQSSSEEESRHADS